MALLAGFTLAGGAPSAHASLPGQNTASETYYHLDVESGTIGVRLEAIIQSQGDDLEEAWFYAMPGATNVQVKQDGQVLESKVETIIEMEGLPLLITARLPAPLKGKLKAELVVTYVVPVQNSEFVRIQPGAIESYFVSQGTGSFVLIDLPSGGENVLDPGCLKAADQPDDLSETGFQRWVCGDALLIGFASDDAKTLEQCAQLYDKCRQRVFDGPFSAYAQSITDPSLSGVLTAMADLAAGPHNLSLHYFATDQEWAERQMALAVRALPRLEALFGFELPNDTIVMRESRQFGWLGIAGVAFPSISEVLLAADTPLDNEVTVHELAHQWVAQNLESKWLWEGLAEWATTSLAADLGYEKYDRDWEAWGYTDPLSTWYNGSAVFNSEYWYGKSGAFWAAYEQAVGGRENMTRILGQLDDNPDILPVGPQWFMDVGEAVSGANLDTIFLEWVWFEQYAGRQLQQRRLVHDQIDALKDRATALGLTGLPTDIQANLDIWAFSKAEGQIAAADEVLVAYQEMLALLAESGLPGTIAVQESWPTTTMAATEAVIVDIRLAIEAIGRAAGTLVDEPDGSEAVLRLQEARAAFASGEVNEATALAAEAEAIVVNAVASVRMVAIAEKVQEDFQGSFFKTIGLLFEDPDGDLEAAKASLAAGDTEAALKQARSAYDTWNGAQGKGLQRLALLAGVMCALSFGAWWVLRRIDGPGEGRVRGAGEGHFLDTPEERKRSWRDWENSK